MRILTDFLGFRSSGTANFLLGTSTGTCTCMDWGQAQVPAHAQVQCTCPSLHYMPQLQPGGNARSALPPFILFKNLVATRFELGFYSISERAPQNLSSKCYHRQGKIDPKTRKSKLEYESLFLVFSLPKLLLPTNLC